MALYPQQSTTAHVEQLGEELCVYDWSRQHVHTLNPTAARVWAMCDGRTSPAQMAEQFADELGSAKAEALVWLSLGELERAKLLAEPLPARGGRQIVTRRQALRVGLAATLLPVIASMLAPSPAAAQTPKVPNGQ
jgi:pyrroloquinoline quinone biosynthesis protein D